MSSSMRLVYVLNFVHENDVSHFYHTFHLLTHLKKLGWEVRVLSEKGGRGRRVVAGHEVTYLSDGSRLLRIIRMIGVIIEERLRGTRLVYVRISKPAAILSGIFGRLVGMKTLYWQSGVTHDFSSTVDSKLSAREDRTHRLINKWVDYFVTGPETMLSYYADVVGVPQIKLRLLYNDIDIARFRAPDHRPDANVRILMVHRFSPVRQTGMYMFPMVDALLQAVQRVRNLELVLIGDGPERAELEAILAPLAGVMPVVFLGALPNADIAQHYRAADIFIMPSYREGFPRVVLEAMAAGLPIVATDAGGTRDLLGPKQQHFVVPREDAGAFAARLLDLVHAPAVRRELANENLERVQKYSTPVVAMMFDRLLASCAPRS